MSEGKSGGLTAKKGCLWAAIGLGGLIVLGAIVGGGGGSETSSTATNGTQAAPVEELAVTSQELAKAYEDNEAAAQQKYGGKPLAVTGTVTGVKLDLMDKPVVQLNGVNPFLPVQGSLADKAAAANLNKDQEVTLHCEGVTEVMSMPQLKACRL